MCIFQPERFICPTQAMRSKRTKPRNGPAPTPRPTKTPTGETWPVCSSRWTTTTPKTRLATLTSNQVKSAYVIYLSNLKQSQKRIQKCWFKYNCWKFLPDWAFLECRQCFGQGTYILGLGVNQKKKKSPTISVDLSLISFLFHEWESQINKGNGM